MTRSLTRLFAVALIAGCAGSEAELDEVGGLTGPVEDAAGSGGDNTLPVSDAISPPGTPWGQDTTNSAVDVPEVAVAPEPDTAVSPPLDTGAEEDVEEQNCPGGFGCPCSDASECYSGYCLEGPDGEWVCSKTCDGECPPGYLCAPAPGASDLTFVCVVQDDQLCAVCVSDDACGNLGGTCIAGQDGTQRCGRGCVVDTDCPAGFACQGFDDSDDQCVPVDGVCPCIAETLGITQACTAESDMGTCRGEQRCQVDGWDGCDAPEPEMEVCDGADQDCDDAIDEEVETLGEACDGDGEGCALGTIVCAPADGGLVCVGDYTPDETCNGEDDDCDGALDEGFADLDEDGWADCVDSDDDGDAVEDEEDNCLEVNNPDQADADADGLGDLCDPDGDGDGVLDAFDNCLDLDNPGQEDSDDDGVGDDCDDDDDGDDDPDVTDCQPLNPTIHAAAEELCDGIDQDCDGQIDEGFPDLDKDGEPDCMDIDDDGDGVIDDVDSCPELANTGQLDSDGDGQGDACDDDDDGDGDPDTTDCAPLDPARHAAAFEVCDGVDQNCDGVVDEGYPDADADGVADCIDQDQDGDGVADQVDNCLGLDNPDQLDTDADGAGDDCDDDDDGDGDPDETDCEPLDGAIFTDAIELCDGVDQNCNGAVDEGFEDLDQDGLANCVDLDTDGDDDPNETDCAPMDATIHAQAEELCDGIDQNCNGAVDEGFADTDGDGTADCTDIDDDADGILDGTDNCPLDANTPQDDLDDDGAGDACDLDDDGDGDLDELDCAPMNPAIFHGAEESCNGIDDNCNEAVDESYPDLDQDGISDCVDDDDDGDGTPDESDTCPMVPNPDQVDTDGDGDGDLCDGDDDGDATPDDLDCAPLDPSIHLTAAEVCDGIDQDCDGTTDEGFDDTNADGEADCVDDDDDGDGDPDDTDCAPLDAAVHHGAFETCNLIDDDCDGQIDNSELCGGCADGTREGFTNQGTHPNVAGCSGGWSIPGVLSTLSPACNYESGNDSANPSGSGCNVADLCAPGWHVCTTAIDFSASSPTGCGSLAAASGLFFTSRQSGPGSTLCGNGANDLFGCGTKGSAPNGNCAPYNRFSQNLCSSLGAPWSCGGDGYQEANNVTKSSSAGGGVLCCRD